MVRGWLVDFIMAFTFFFPIVMSIVWILFGLIHRAKNRKIKEEEVLDLDELWIEIVTPVFNEEKQIYEILKNNCALHYKNYRLIVIDDKSTDNSVKEIHRFLQDYPNAPIVFHEMPENSGKARVLNYAIDSFVTSKYFVCVDSDSKIATNTLKILNYYLQNEKDERVVAYTSSIVLLEPNKSNLHRLQQVEYRTIIAMIKRAQMQLTDQIMTLSGAFSVYKTKVVKEVGFFDTTNATEDIEITWRLAKNKYKSKFIPEIFIRIDTPSSTSELLSQRQRWTLGGMQTIKKYSPNLFRNRMWPQKLFTLEFIASSLWVFSFYFTTFWIFSSVIFKFPENIRSSALIVPTLILAFFSFLLLFFAWLINSEKRESLPKFIMTYVLFPSLYWFMIPFSYTLGVIDFIQHFKSPTGKWRSQKTNNLKLKKAFSVYVDLVVTLFVVIALRTVVLGILGFIWHPMAVTSGIFFLIFYAFLIISYYYKDPRKTFGLNLFGLEHKYKGKTPSALFSILRDPVVIMWYLVILSYVVQNIHLITNTSFVVAQNAINTFGSNINIFAIVAFFAFSVLALDRAFFGVIDSLKGSKVGLKKEPVEKKRLICY